MGCERVEVPGGWIIHCSRGRLRAHCSVCGREATQRCDWKLKGSKLGQTCDRWLCRTCSFTPAPDKDLCPVHRKMYDEWLAARGGSAKP